ncbi:Dolichyl-phosphate-mannose:protein O-mannosyl transferase [Trachipleistophora hominis]|uniref:Dolichyl-phosphate-mannose--protein mannosyltransferase n=1 Tax=Trachipleistophora hominis TaxID=72359 RepID=L7JRN5_TRAHO|nr:Dolichyl-phosphate-mannose:protein O-mannosyl transferase [Trachipleistophora hominis]
MDKTPTNSSEEVNEQVEEEKNIIKQRIGGTTSICSEVNEKLNTKNKSSKGRIGEKSELFLLCLIFLVSFLVRSYKIEKGNFVIWDEAHFGKFASKYLQRLFYFDVHPPLGKMLTALSGYMFGQDVNFKFDSGTSYPAQMDYVGMRRFHAFISSFVPVFSYLTLREMSFDVHCCSVIAFMIIFENSLVCISRLILLDSHLLFFTSMVMYALAKYIRKRTIPNLVLLGTALGCVQSVKWIGCFTTFLVGIFIIAELWLLLIQKDVAITRFARLFTERALFLIILPIIIYLAFFLIHFGIVNRSSPDDGHMSSFFQSTLKGNEHKFRKYVEYGTIVTVKSNKLSGQYLHSHKDEYPENEGCQMTTYGHKDENNYWAFQKVVDGDTKVEMVKNNDEVVIMHMNTFRYLNLVDKDAYVTKEDRLLSTSPNTELFRSNLFKVEVVDDMITKEDKIKTLTTRFRLKSVDENCYVRSTNKRYPQWGFRQGEVTCSRKKDSSTLWNIEMNNKVKDEDLEYKELSNLKTAVFYNIVEHNALMYITNKSFVQDDDLEPIRIVSQAYEWPILRRGLRMCSWSDENVKFYMFGNPFSWYLSLACVLAAPTVLLCKTLTQIRNRQRIDARMLIFCCLFCGGWAIHFLPFFFIGRVLYFHHYLPAMYFSMHTLLVFVRNHKLLYTILFIQIIAFVLYSPLTYGFYDQNVMRWLKLLPTWDFVDDIAE